MMKTPIAPMSYVRLLEAMMSGYPVVASDGVEGRLDELYKSVADDGLRARICDQHGRVHHYDVEHLKLK